MFSWERCINRGVNIPNPGHDTYYLKDSVSIFSPPPPTPCRLEGIIRVTRRTESTATSLLTMRTRLLKVCEKFKKMFWEILAEKTIFVYHVSDLFESCSLNFGRFGLFFVAKKGSVQRFFDFLPVFFNCFIFWNNLGSFYPVLGQIIYFCSTSCL